MRIALGLEYDGGGFAGWQVQAGQRTVQGVVEGALAKVADGPIQTVCAGRTDAGVHSMGQVIHFDPPAARPERAWVCGTNSNMPADVRVLWARPMAAAFHARLSATARWYRYRIFNRDVRPALERHRATWHFRRLDAARMQAAAVNLLGRHDFSAFRAAECQARLPVRTVYRVDVAQDGPWITVDVIANSFLHHMVRNIVGVLMAVGEGHREPGWAAEVLAGRDRSRGGITAPGTGLYFVGAFYPPAYGVPPPGCDNLAR